MSRKIKINRLMQDELTYELNIRGIGTGTCERMRTSLAKAMQMEKEGSSLKRPPHPYTFSEDATAVTEKLKDISEGLATFNEGKKSNQYAKWETKLNHILGRVESMQVPDEDKEKLKVKSEFYAKILGLMSDLDEKATTYEKQNITPAEISILHLDDSSESGNDEEEVNDTSRTNNTGTVRRIVKSTPVARWDLHFTGEKKGMSLNAFLQRVEELRVARHVSKEELFDTAVDLFQGKALVWYRAVREEVSCWDDMVQFLREEFQPSDLLW